MMLNVVNIGTFVILITYGLIYTVRGSNNVEVSAATCDKYDLFDFAHLEILPVVERASTPFFEEVDYQFCTFKESCCDTESLIEAKAVFSEASVMLGALQNTVEKIWSDPDDVRVLLEAFLQQLLADDELYAPTKYRFISHDLRESIRNLVVEDNSFESRLVTEKLFTFLDSLLSYFAATTCTVCDVNSRNYLTVDYNSGNRITTLNLFRNVCTEIGQDFNELMSAVANLAKSRHIQPLVVEVLYQFCLVDDIHVSCERDSYYDDVNTFMQKFILNGKLEEMICGPYESCDKHICNNVLKGLALDLDSTRDNIMSFLQRSCPYDWLYYCRKLHDKLSQTLPTHNINVNSENLVVNKYSDLDVGTSDYFDALTVAKDGKMSSHAFEKFDFVHHRRHPEGRRRSFAFVFFKSVFYLLLVAGLFYAAYFVYKKRSEGETWQSFYESLRS